MGDNMNPLDIIIDNKKYEYVNDIIYNNKNYIAFKDDNYLYIKEFTFDNELIFLDINDSLYDTLRKMMNCLLSRK